jgi:hypothetical protein
MDWTLWFAGVICLLAAMGAAATVGYNLGRSVMPVRPDADQTLRRLAALERKLAERERDLSEEAAALRQLIDSRFDEAMSELALRRPQVEDRPWGARARAAGA